MKPGRELDALIGEKVMGLKNIEIRDHGFDKPDLSHLQENGYFGDVPFYSTDISAAWEVVEMIKTKLHRGLSWKVEIFAGAFNSSRTSVIIYGDKEYSSDWCATAPYAICLAALKAVGFEMEKQNDRP